MTDIVPYPSAEVSLTPLAVSLPRYAQISNFSEAAFFGVQTAGATIYACRNIWTMQQRQAIARELLAAQGEFWKHCGYPFVPTYVTDERHEYNRKSFKLHNCRVIALGKKTETLLQAGYALNHANDPTIITLAVTFTDANELHVYHPGTRYEIIPSSRSIAGGTATIAIPRVRMVALANENNPAQGWLYTDLTKFEATVDIYRIYTDPTQTVQVFGKDCDTWSNFWNDAWIHDYSVSWIHLGNRPATQWGVLPHYMQANYLCGVETIDPHMEDALVRLAHARMPNEPCGCDILKMVWERDRHVPDILDSERLNCPFGMSDGAWQSWMFLQDLVCMRGSHL